MDFLREEIREMFVEWKERLTIDEKGALYLYSKYSSDEINDVLKNNLINDPEFGCCPEDSEIENMIDLIDSALAKFVSKHPISIYRAEVHNSKKTAEDLKEFLEGVSRLEYKSFVSTSFSVETGQEIMRLLKEKYGATVYLFIKAKIPEGKGLGYLCKELSAMGDGEDEILIARNITLEIDKISMDGDDTVILEGYFS